MFYLTSLAITTFVLLQVHALPPNIPSPVAPATLPTLPLTSLTLKALDELPVIHFTITRRGGPFESFAPGEEVANLTHLANVLLKTENRFNLTRREVKGNKLVRKAKVKSIGGNDVGKLISEVAQDGRWYAKIRIGQPPQEIEMDLDMLTTDFYVLTTTSNKGTKYDDIFSKSFVRSSAHPFPYCSSPSETFHLPTLNADYPLTFAYCRPLKQSTQTLGPSGSMLGLAPSSHLSQINSPNLLTQLFDQKIIERPIFSIMLINGQEGVLSIGGTAAKAVDMVVQQTKFELDRLAVPPINPIENVDQTGNQVEEQEDSTMKIDNGIETTGDKLGGALDPTNNIASSTEQIGDLLNGPATPGLDGTEQVEHNPESLAATSINLNDRIKSLFSKLAASVDEVDEISEQGAGQVDRQAIPGTDDTEGSLLTIDKLSDNLVARSVTNNDGAPALAKRGQRAVSTPTTDIDERGQDWRESWRWSKVQGAEGFWQILLQGVWVDKAKILKNQPAVIDINSPFILAPPLAAKAFYASVSGSFQLQPPMQGFYAFPCLNPPVVAFEFNGWQFPALQGGKGSAWFGMPGGKFSLGRLKEGSGYCLGAVVETSMGIGGGREDELAGNGMKDVWVIGEGFFRGVGGVFDFREQKVGFRTY